MYYFNSFLFENLPALFCTSANSVSEKVFGNRYMYKRKCDNQDNILVSDIVKVCNSFHISVSHFITSSPVENTLKNRFKYVIETDDFKEVKFHPENMRCLYGKNGLTNIPSMAEFSKDTGLSLTTVVRWQNPEIGGTTVNKLVSICNQYGIDIDVFLEDKNEKLPKFASTEADVSPRLLQEMNELKEAMEEYRQDCRELKEENRRLRIKISEGEFLSETNERERYGENKIRKWSANWELLENFHKVVGVPRGKVIQVAGMKHYGEMIIEGNMLITSLIKICNRFQISTRHIFYRGSGSVPSLNVYDYYKSVPWKKVVFHPERINDLFGKESITGMTRYGIAEKIGVGDWKLRSWRKENSTLRIRELLDICNKLNITPYCLITDNNRTDLYCGMTYAEILLEENRMLRQQVIRMKEKIRSKQETGILSDE